MFSFFTRKTSVKGFNDGNGVLVQSVGLSDKENAALRYMWILTKEQRNQYISALESDLNSASILLTIQPKNVLKKAIEEFEVAQKAQQLMEAGYTSPSMDVENDSTLTVVDAGAEVKKLCVTFKCDTISELQTKIDTELQTLVYQFNSGDLKTNTQIRTHLDRVKTLERVKYLIIISCDEDDWSFVCV